MTQTVLDHSGRNCSCPRHETRRRYNRAYNERRKAGTLDRKRGPKTPGGRPSLPDLYDALPPAAIREAIELAIAAGTPLLDITDGSAEQVAAVWAYMEALNGA